MKRQPKKLKEAVLKLSKELGINVGSAYGLGHHTGDESKWFIIVWSNKVVPNMPKEFEGYPVVRYMIPVPL